MITGQIVMLRLATGEDIIGTVVESVTEYQVIAPFKVIFRRFQSEAKGAIGLMIVPWLPSELLSEQTIIVPHSQVVCVLHPKQEFIDYYQRTSDEYYMFMVEHEYMYRQQLMSLPTSFSMPSSHPYDFDGDFMNQESEGDDDEFDGSNDSDERKWH